MKGAVVILHLGDSNIELFKIIIDKFEAEYVNSEGYINLINRERVINAQFSLLGHIFINCLLQQINSEVMIDALSDHCHPIIPIITKKTLLRNLLKKNSLY